MMNRFNFLVLETIHEDTPINLKFMVLITNPVKKLTELKVTGNSKMYQIHALYNVDAAK
jgi:hypothetical protein